MTHKTKETAHWYYDIVIEDIGNGLERNRRAMRSQLEAWKFHKRIWRSRTTGKVIEERDSEIIVTCFMGQDIEFCVFRPAHKVKGGEKWGCLMHIKGCGLVRMFGKTRREALLRAWGSDK